MAERKVRYAVVGLGWIARDAVVPGFKNAANSELAALVTGDRAKGAELAKAHGVERVCAYDQYDELLASGAIDAVFIALPNNMHADYTVRAARAGVHILCEKPMGANSGECDQMMRAASQGGVKLMIGYRLHFEPSNLKVIELIAAGRIGEPRIFSSTFTQQVSPGNSRLSKQLAGGPLPDMGVYPINASRYLFRAEPVEVSAVGANNGDPRFGEVHEAVAATLRFPGDRLASFTCSFGAAPVDSWFIGGTEGSVRVEPGFGFTGPMTIELTAGEETTRETVPHHDQFGGEIDYFSECILNDVEPEPNGKEGLADVRIVEALIESMRKGAPVKLPLFSVDRRPDMRLARAFPA